jgi:hypothetical protein
MNRPHAKTQRWVFILLLVLAACSAMAEDQQPQRQPGWPCDRKIDPTYIQIAEESGGQVQLFQPSEMSGSTTLLEAHLSGNEETIFRTSGNLNGDREFILTIDSSIESVTFSVFIQCMKSISFFGPSGEILQGAPDAKLNDFISGRILTLKSPAKGIWKITLSGTGYFSAIAEAKTDLTLEANFVEIGGRPGHEGYFPIQRQPKLNASETLSIELSARVRKTRIKLIDREGNVIEDLKLQKVSDDEDSSEFVGPVLLRHDVFRVIVEGIDQNGESFQRYYHRLFHAQ